MISKKAGFSLLEVLVVTIVLAFVAIGVVQTIRSTVTAQELVDRKSALTQLSRSAVGVMERDVSLAFFVKPEELVWAPFQNLKKMIRCFKYGKSQYGQFL